MDTRYPGWHELAGTATVAAVVLSVGGVLPDEHPAELALVMFGLGTLLLAKPLNWSLARNPVQDTDPGQGDREQDRRP